MLLHTLLMNRSRVFSKSQVTIKHSFCIPEKKKIFIHIYLYIYGVFVCFTIDCQSGCCLLISTHTCIISSILHIQIMDNQLCNSTILSHFIFAACFEHLLPFLPLHHSRFSQLTVQRSCPTFFSF